MFRVVAILGAAMAPSAASAAAPEQDVSSMLRRHADLLQRHEDVLGLLAARLQSLEELVSPPRQHDPGDASSRVLTAASFWPPTRIDSRAVRSEFIHAHDLNVTGNLHLRGTLYWHGKPVGFDLPTPVPTPLPTPIPTILPTLPPTYQPTPQPTYQPTPEPVYTSCEDAYAKGYTVSGMYLLQTISTAYSAYCDMTTLTTGRHGWVHVASITNADSKGWSYGDGSSPYQDQSVPFYPNSRWESSDPLFDDTPPTDPSTNLDFRSQAWRELKPKYMMIKWQGSVLLTTSSAGCFQDAASLAAFFSQNSWACGGSANVEGCSVGCPCTGHNLGEDALGYGSTFSAVYFKAGEADGVQDSNKDRAYIRTVVHTSNVDAPMGLGSFCGTTDPASCGGGNYGSFDAGLNNDGAVQANAHIYNIFIQTGEGT